MTKGHDLVPWQSFKSRHHMVQEYVLQLYNEHVPAREHHLTLETLTEKFEMSPEPGPQTSMPDETRTGLAGVITFLQEFILSLRSCAVTIPAGVQIKVHRKTQNNNPPKMGLRPCAVASTNTFMPHWKGTLMPLWLKPGTQVVPAMLLYTDQFIIAYELEMLVLDGKYIDEKHETVGPVGDFGSMFVHSNNVTRLRI